jgi:hypothetical protein
MNMGIIAASRLRARDLTGFLLNDFSGGSLGLSLDLLDSDYTGSAIKVRRSSDNTELDIGFVNNELDTASLLDFVGSGNGFVSIIYDQVGSNNMVQNNASLQGKIVSNGSIILKGGKPCIIRSIANNGGYLSNYNPNGSGFKGMFYVGDNELKRCTIFGGNTTGPIGFIVEENSSSTIIDRQVTAILTRFNSITTTISNRDEAFIATNNQFLLYRELNFNFETNFFGLGFFQNFGGNNGMMTFQELVIFENTDNAVAKENNINFRYNIY